MKVRPTYYFLLAASVLAVCPGSVIAQDAAESPPETSLAQAAELPRRYVSDKLVLNVYADPDPASARVATIETGDAVGEIESTGNYIRVRLENGREGWVGASYLTAEAPAAARLRELQDRQKDAVSATEKKAADEIARLKKEAAALQLQVSELQSAASTAATPSGEAPTQTQIPPQATSEIETERQPATDSPTNRSNTVWIWSFSLVLAIGAGFTAGYQALARRIRRRYGALKIY